MIVMIEWVDSNSCGGWHSKEDVPELAIVCSVGIVVKSTANAVTITQSVSDSFHNTITIPKCAIQRQRRLRIG